MKIIISTIKSWNIKEAKKFIKKNKDKEIYIITNKNELTYGYILTFESERIISQI